MLWLCAFEVLPWLHIATHDHVGKHHHDASGAIVLDEETDHDDHPHHHDHDDADAEVDEHAHDDHDAEVDEHDHDDHDAEVDEHGNPVTHEHHEHHHTTSDPEKRLRDALGHGRHSLAHHDIATTSPAAPLTTPLPVDWQATFLFADTAIEPYSFSPGRAVARGPPTLTFES